MQTTMEQQQTLNQHEVAKAAWLIWQQEGCQHGRAQEHWIKAEQQLLEAKNRQSGKIVNSAAKRRASPAAARRLATRQLVLTPKS
jgi:hypothetical protein